MERGQTREWGNFKAPFPWFGGKTRAAQLIWERLGDCPNFVEPFFGSGAVLLNRPHAPGLETVNDLDGFVSNTWRALAAAPEEVVQWADYPANECDLHARHLWLKARRQALTERLMGDPAYYDAKIAGWWLWGMAHWIAGGWCFASGSGPWGTILDEDGHARFVRVDDREAGETVSRQLLHLKGHRGVAASGANLLPWFRALQERLRRVRVCCGDWQRIMGSSVTRGLTGMLLDPPYATEENRDMNVYAEDSGTVAHDVRDWCLANGGNPLLRIILCGYEDTHDALLDAGWTKVGWKANGGYANGSKGATQGKTNKHREMLWCSPACLVPGTEQLGLL